MDIDKEALEDSLVTAIPASTWQRIEHFDNPGRLDSDELNRTIVIDFEQDARYLARHEAAGSFAMAMAMLVPDDPLNYDVEIRPHLNPVPELRDIPGFVSAQHVQEFTQAVAAASGIEMRYDEASNSVAFDLTPELAHQLLSLRERQNKRVAAYNIDAIRARALDENDLMELNTAWIMSAQSVNEDHDAHTMDTAINSCASSMYRLLVRRLLAPPLPFLSAREDERSYSEMRADIISPVFFESCRAALQRYQAEAPSDEGVAKQHLSDTYLGLVADEIKRQVQHGHYSSGGSGLSGR